MDAQLDLFPEPDLPLYASHKVLRAAEIRGIEIGTLSCALTVVYPSEEGIVIRRIAVPDEFFFRKRPLAGDFYVEYEDGYQSWSPRKNFLEGYAPVRITVTHNNDHESDGA